MDADKVTAIRAKAEALAGQSLGEHGDALVEMAMQRACAVCQRSDIPEEMEQAVAALVLSMAEGTDGAAVKSLTRGDTSISYDTAQSGAKGAESLLAPFRRLGRVQP